MWKIRPIGAGAAGHDAIAPRREKDIITSFMKKGILSISDIDGIEAKDMSAVGYWQRKG